MRIPMVVRHLGTITVPPLLRATPSPNASGGLNPTGRYQALVIPIVRSHVEMGTASRPVGVIDRVSFTCYRYIFEFAYRVHPRSLFG